MSTRSWCAVAVLGLFAVVGTARAEVTSNKSSSSRTSASATSANMEKSGPSPTAETVEMFAAMKSGDIDVKLVCRDSRGGNVLITNNTKKPLKIALPEAFAAVPVLAQFGGGMAGMGGMGGMGGGGMGGMGGMGGGGMQGMGGGMGGMGGGGMGGMMGGGGMGGMGGGGGFFNVGPEKVGKIKVNTVCLEHGKKDPNIRVPYRLIPIESFTQKEDVIQLCKMLGRGEIPQNSAQAAAWHMANGLSWGELAAKVRIKHFDGSTEMYFSPGEVEAASRISAESSRRAAAQPAPKQVTSPGDKLSSVTKP